MASRNSIHRRDEVTRAALERAERISEKIRKEREGYAPLTTESLEELQKAIDASLGLTTRFNPGRGR